MKLNAPATAASAQRIADLSAVMLAGLLFGRPLVAGLILAVGVLVLVTVGGLYRPRLNLSVLTVATPLFLLSFVVAVIVDSLAMVGSSGPMILAMSLATAALVVVFRSLAIVLVKTSRHQRIVRYPTVVLGGAEEGARINRLLAEHPEYGLEPLEVIVPTGLDTGERLGKTIEQSDASVLVVMSDSVPEADLVALVRAHREQMQVFVTLPLIDLFGAEARNDIDMLWDVPLLRIPRGTGSPGGRAMKRIMDITAAGAVVMVLSPVLLGIAAMVRLFIGSPILFRQERVGLDGRRIEVMKFRTITWKSGEGGQVWNASASQAAEINWLGRVLRATSLDELPQLFNVLRGDMSLVGPRPERPVFVAQYSEQYAHYGHRHRMPAGLTGLSQVLGLRGDTSIDDRARFDNRYIDGWSIGLDLRIMLRTIRAVFAGEGR